MIKIRYKAIKYAILFLPLILILVYVLHSFIAETKNDILINNRQYLSEISYQNAAAVKKVVEQNFDKLAAIAEIIGNENELNQEIILNYLSLEANRSSYKRMGFATPDGRAITTDDQSFNISDRDYFYTALNGEFSLSDRLSDKKGNDDILVYAVPLYHNSEIMGVIFATYTTEILSEILRTPLFGEDGYMYIITKDGSPIVYIENKNSGSAFTNLFDEIAVDQNVKEMQENMKAGKNDILEYTKNGNKRIAAYCKVGINDWYIVSVVPTEVITQNTNKIIKRNIAFSMIVAILFLLFTAYLILQHKKSTYRLKHIAYFDDLTGFPNYNAFKENASERLKKNPDKQFIFYLLDVENFKLINERLGFETGNRVLKNMALAISDSINEPEELFARISIDEYIIMLNYNCEEYPKNSCIRFEARFQELMGKDFIYYIKFPTGSYITDKGETSVDQIYEKVNYAHRKAKLLSIKFGVTEFIYDDAEKEKVLQRIDIENRMDYALVNKEFIVFLQPKYLLKTRTIIGAEALVRWQNSDGKIILPGEFIPIFEQNGFIVQLDMYMFEEVCIIIKDWISQNKQVIPISVNFSRLNLISPDFVKRLVAITELYNIPNKYIEIELTESVIFENENLMIDVLHQAHEVGFLLSMDDFGSGYSSLGLLKNLPVDVIKIDRSFFLNNKYKERAENVIKIIMLLADKLNALTVAEGVEDVELINFLDEIGCDIVQGFFFAKPMPLSDFNDLM